MHPQWIDISRKTVRKLESNREVDFRLANYRKLESQKLAILLLEPLPNVDDLQAFPVRPRIHQQSFGGIRCWIGLRHEVV